MFLSVIKVILIFLGSVLILHSLLRLVRRFYKFPIPHFLTALIDHPIRRRFWQPPAEMPHRHGIQSGMRVLEVGPGRGTYTLAAARQVGVMGEIMAIDIEPRIIRRLQQVVQEQGVNNVKAEVANVHDLPYEKDTFDLVYLMSVIGEIPSPDLALREFHRILRSEGILAFSEMLPDPDYPTRRWLTKLASHAGFEPRSSHGTLLNYTLTFSKREGDEETSHE